MLVNTAGSQRELSRSAQRPRLSDCGRRGKQAEPRAGQGGKRRGMPNGQKNVTVGRAEMARSHIDKHGMGLSKVITTT